MLSVEAGFWLRAALWVPCCGGYAASLFPFTFWVWWLLTGDSL